MVLTFAVACSLLGADPPNEKANEKATDQKLVDAGREVCGGDRMTLLEATSKAMKEIKGAVPIEIKAENPSGKKLFGTYLLKGDALHEVEIDVVTGDIVKSKEKSIDASKLSQYKSMATRCKLSFSRAVERARERCKAGVPIRVRIEEKASGKESIVQVGVYMLDGNRLVEVELNGEHGEVLAVKEKTYR